MEDRLDGWSWAFPNNVTRDFITKEVISRKGTQAALMEKREIRVGSFLELWFHKALANPERLGRKLQAR